MSAAHTSVLFSPQNGLLSFGGGLAGTWPFHFEQRPNRITLPSVMSLNNNADLKFWSGQVIHFVGLAVLLALLFAAWEIIEKPFLATFWIAALIPVLHQVFVWIAWRSELRSSMISKTIGFCGYVIVFFVLFAGRFLALGILAYMDRGSLELGTLPIVLLTGALTVPSVYAIYSVHRYFGLARAAGADHFEEQYRTMPLVKKGIFRYTENGMYIYAFLSFWAIAISFNSAAALVIAAFGHAYIWIHYFATEKPDMVHLYPSSETS